MSYKYTKQPLVKQIFNDDYTRKIWKGGEFGVSTGFRNYIHHGVDYGASIGEGLFMLEDGLTTFAFTKGSSQLEKDYGISVGMYIPKWDVTIAYSHCSELLVGPNTNIKKGTKVALSGNTGKSTGPHVDVMIAPGRRIKLQTVYDNAFDFETFKPKLKEDGKVKIKKSAKKYVTGEDIPDAYKGKPYTIQESTKDKVLIKELYSWVYRSDLEGYVAPTKPSYVGKYFNTYKETYLHNISGVKYAIPTNNRVSYKIQAEVNGMFKLVSRNFRGTEEPNTVYVKKDLKAVSDKPRYRVG